MVLNMVKDIVVYNFDTNLYEDVPITADDITNGGNWYPDYFLRVWRTDLITPTGSKVPDQYDLYNVLGTDVRQMTFHDDVDGHLVFVSLTVVFQISETTKISQAVNAINKKSKTTARTLNGL